MPTPMHKSETKHKTVGVRSFQPTPMGKHGNTSPSLRGSRITQSVREKENEITSNSIPDDFSPVFEVSPNVRENFAIVKVKNHNLVDQDSNNDKSTTPIQPRFSASNKAEKQSKLLPRKSLKKKVSNDGKPTKRRGRIVKKKIGRGSRLTALKNANSRNHKRKRLQF